MSDQPSVTITPAPSSGGAPATHAGLPDVTDGQHHPKLHAADHDPAAIDALSALFALVADIVAHAGIAGAHHAAYVAADHLALGNGAPHHSNALDHASYLPADHTAVGDAAPHHASYLAADHLALGNGAPHHSNALDHAQAHAVADHTTAVNVRDEGGASAATLTLDFVGAGVSVVVAAGVATVTVPGGAGSDPQYAPGSYTIATGTYRACVKRQSFTGAQRLTVQGTGRVSIHN